MKELRSIITLLFKRIPPDYIFKTCGDYNKSRNLVANGIFYDKSLHYRLHEILSYYSHDEVENIWQRAQEEWSKQSKYGGNNGPRKGDSSVFNLLGYYTNTALILERNTPVVRYDHLLSWRRLSLQLGDDLLTCSFVASKDLESNHDRTFFCWSPILGTNNIRLRNLLSMGMAENHFHLYGSSPHFEISWICLMNQIESRKKEFDEFRGKKKRYLDPDVQFGSSSDEDLQVLTIKAAYIRLLLFRSLHIEKFGLPSRSNIGQVTSVQNHQDGKENRGISKDEDKWFFGESTIQLLSSQSNLGDSKFLFPYVNILQQKINTFRHLLGMDCVDRGNFTKLDYAITKDMSIHKDNPNLLLCGERKFLYDCFKAIERGDSRIVRYQDLFYAYLIIKERLRKELIQINDSVGFTNFQLYQNRKGIFLDRKKIYSDKMAELAIRPTIKNQHVEHIEARFSPKKTDVDLIRHIEECNNQCFPLNREDKINKLLKLDQKDIFRDCIRKERDSNWDNLCWECNEDKCKYSRGRNEKLRYVLHFIKSKQEKKSKDREFIEMVQCRDYEKRKEVEREAKAIDSLLCSLNPIRHRIVGIDAASSELDNRPEVFGQAFRYLKGKRDSGEYGHLYENIGRPQIRATFHAGEDFFDVVDGLRAIDEAIKYLNLGEGDRIGHAIALGIDVRDYYMSKHRSLMLPKQWHLDNLCWLVSRIHKYNLHQFSSFCQYLRWDFQNLFMKMYKDVEFDSKSGITPELYFEAWRLRGDDPYLYNLEKIEKDKKPEEYLNHGENNCKDGKDKYIIDVREENRLTYWQKCGINEAYPYRGCKRIVPEVNRLYYEYHFNPEIKKRGEDMFPFEIKKEYIEVVEAVQKCYQKEIQERHLAIETNPSSNVLIGTFKRYDKHPLVNLFNLGLETDPEKIRNCPQLFVSINTDDQGVFNTYLENEYALMALALEKMEDENGNKLYNPAMIYDWLDRIRAMGMEMRFGKV